MGGKYEFAIYRKHTDTDSIIPNDYYYPCSHKFSSISYLINRLNMYSASKNEQEDELNIIINKLHYKYIM